MENEIKAMPYYNLLLSSNPIKQATTQNGNNTGDTLFSETKYWKTGEMEIDMGNTDNKIQRYITAYKTTLANMGADDIEVRISRYNELKATGMTNVRRNPSQKGRYFVGSGIPGLENYIFHVHSDGSLYDSAQYNKTYLGVRPIIIIKK